MSGDVLFDAPGPRTVARHRVYTGITLLVIIGLVLLILGKLNETGQLEYAKWEPFVTPSYLTALLVEGLLKTLQMAFSSVILAVVFGVLFGIGKLSDHAWLRWPCWAVVEFFRAVPVLLPVAVLSRRRTRCSTTSR